MTSRVLQNQKPSKNVSTIVQKKPSALAISPKAVAPTVTMALAAFAQSIVKAGLDDLTFALDQLKQWTKAQKDLKEVIDTRLEPMILKAGEVVTDKGTVELTTGDGQVLRAQPTRTGYDPKKLEQVLRLNKVSPETCMDATVSYKINQSKLQVFLQAGILTEEQLKPALYEAHYSIRLGGRDE